MPAELRELSYAKLNLFLKIINKREDGYHNLRSAVTRINLFDEIIAEKNSKFIVNYIGDFAPKNNSFDNCIIERIFSILNIEKPNYCFTIKKNIPVQSGLGSASSNAAAVIKILEKLEYRDLKIKNFAKVGADIPFFIHNEDSLLRGIGEINIKTLFPKYYFLIIKPNINCSTNFMYKQINLDNLNYDPNFDTDEINEFDNGNDFEIIAKDKYHEINEIFRFMQSLPDAIFTRLTGSGSCIFSAFESKITADNSLILSKKKFPELWSAVVENNFL